MRGWPFSTTFRSTISSFGGFWQSWWDGHFEDLQRLNVLGAEMEASLIFVLTRVWGLRAGGVAVVLDNVLNVSGESAEFDPEQQLDHGPDRIAALARLACETVRQLAAAE